MMESTKFRSLTSAVSGVINPTPAPEAPATPEVVTEGAEKDTKGDKEKYQKFFNKTLKKYGADSPEDLPDEDKKKFYDEIDAGWKADDEKPEKNESVELEEGVKESTELEEATVSNNYGATLTPEKFVSLYGKDLPQTNNNLTMRFKIQSFGFNRVPREFADKVIAIVSKSQNESVELEEAVKPKVGHEVRFKGSDGLVSVDKIYDVFGDEVETDKNELVFKTKDLIWKGKYWEVSPKGRKESVELEEDFGSDEAMVMELELFAENDRGLYNQFRSIIKNLIGKEINGKYDHKAAIKLWGYYADAAAKAYAKEFGGPDFRSLLTVRRSLAKKLADQELPAIKGALQGVNMEYEDLLPKNKKKIEAYRASMNESVEELEETTDDLSWLPSVEAMNSVPKHTPLDKIKKTARSYSSNLLGNLKKAKSLIKKVAMEQIVVSEHFIKDGKKNDAPKSYIEAKEKKKEYWEKILKKHTGFGKSEVSWIFSNLDMINSIGREQAYLDGLSKLIGESVEELEEEAFKGESFLNKAEQYWGWFKVNKENDYLSSASAFLNDFFNLYKNTGMMPKHAFKKATDLKGKISKELKKLGISESVEELEEKRKSRSDYEIYHDSYSSALSEVLDLVERNGYKVNEDLWFNKVSTGPRKPSDGKTNSFTLELEKDGKETRKVVSFQVYGLDSGRYELNAYIS